MTENKSGNRTAAPTPRGTVVDDVIEKITNLILEEGLRPGDKLFTELDLMARLGVGRSSLREAIKTLCALGILEIQHGKGTYISSGSTSMLTRPLKWGLFLSGTSVKEIIDARSVIEVALARWAAERASEEDIASINVLLQELDNHREDRTKYVEYDLKFHMAIATASKNELLSTVLMTMQHILRTWMDATFSEIRSTKHSMEMHKQIFAAIAAHDPEEAGKAMMIHTSDGPLRAAAEQLYPGTMTPISAFNMTLSRGR